MVERVLGSFLPSQTPTRGALFARVEIGQTVVGSTISEVQVFLLGDDPTQKHN